MWRIFSAFKILRRQPLIDTLKKLNPANCINTVLLKILDLFLHFTSGSGLKYQIIGETLGSDLELHLRH
jgi:hypothetical protein